MKPYSNPTTRRFSEDVRDAAVQRFLTSDLTLTAVAEQFGTTRYSVSNWVQQAQAQARDEMKPKTNNASKQPATPIDSRSASEKLRLLIAAGGLSDEQLGEFLRREVTLPRVEQREVDD